MQIQNPIRLYGSLKARTAYMIGSRHVSITACYLHATYIEIAYS